MKAALAVLLLATLALGGCDPSSWMADSGGARCNPCVSAKPVVKPVPVP